MALTTERIINVTAKYETLAEMRQAANEAKASMEGLTEGTAEYEEALAAAKDAQNDYNVAARIAVKENSAAKGSYNDLVNQLARLKEAWKSTGDAVERAELTKKVNDVKEQLADMDHSIGNWQRNVGNYMNAASSSLGTLGEGLEKSSAATHSFAGAAKNAASAMKLMATNPIGGLLQLLLPLIIQIVAKLKENNAVMDAGKKLLKAYEPILNIINKLISKLAEWIGKVADYAAKLIGKVVEGITGVKQEVETATEETVEAMESPKVLQKAEDAGKKAAEAYADALDKAFKDMKLDEDDTLYGDTAETLKKAQKDAEATEKMLKARRDLQLKYDNIAADREEQDIIARNERKLALLQQYMADATAAGDVTGYLEAQQQAADLEVAIAEEKERRKTEAVRTEAEKRKAVEAAAWDAVADILGNVADMYEANIKARVEQGKISAQEGEKEFERVRAMQISVATMQMLTGITTALSGAFTTKSGPWDIALAAIQAATIAASGIANIVKIKNTTLGSSQSGTVSTPPAEALQAPAVQETVPQTRVVTNAEDEELLNQRAAAQRVYVVQSDIEGAGTRAAVVDAETSF